MKELIEIIEKESVYSKDKSSKHAEVFTPRKIIIDMLKSIPKENWYDPTKKILDPCAGKGNFPSVIINILMKTLKNKIKDKDERYKHIIENMIYMCEFQRDSAEFIDKTFSLNKNIKVNLYVGDTLEMPDDFFDLSYEERKIKYPQYTISNNINKNGIDIEDNNVGRDISNNKNVNNIKRNIVGRDINNNS